MHVIASIIPLGDPILFDEQRAVLLMYSLIKSDADSPKCHIVAYLASLPLARICAVLDGEWRCANNEVLDYRYHFKAGSHTLTVYVKARVNCRRCSSRFVKHERGHRIVRPIGLCACSVGI